MRKSFVALLLLLGAAATLATGALAAVDELNLGDINGKVMNAQMAKELRASRAARLGSQVAGNDTTYVGYNPAYAASNYWSIGVGGYIHDGGPNDAGYWNFETPIHGDSLQGWIPTRFLYTTTGGLTLNDIARPWWAVDQGNQINNKIKPGGRTLGVNGVWHVDPGATITASIPGTNPVAPTWAPLSGTQSAWCGIRSHGDMTAIDPLTGNYFTDDAHMVPFLGASTTTGMDRKFPGYCSQWDQMLYRDVDVTGATTVLVRFRYQTAMSTGAGATASTRTGWFDKDPLAAVVGNFIESSNNPTPPVDSFMVYVGNPVEPVAGVDNDFVGSDGLGHDIFDVQRRWLSEIIDVSGATFYQNLLSRAGNNANQQVQVSFDATQLAGTTARLVFRCKTNRGFDDEAGSISGTYSSGGAGAVQVDDVEYSTNGGTTYTMLGDFENASDIDNSVGVSALAAWKSTGKPPATYTHLATFGVDPLVYKDLCGDVGSPGRICDLGGTILSNGDKDNGERLAGTLGTSEQETREGAMSPTINLVVPANPALANNMGLKADDIDATEDYYFFYELYTGYFNLPVEGNGWQWIGQSYPAVQSDGVRAWGSPRTPPFQFFNPDRQCFLDLEPYYTYDMIRTSNASSIPDSMRVGFLKLGQCFRFGISADCGLPEGAYWDNIAFAMIDGAGTAPISASIWNLLQDTFPANESAALVGNPAAFDTTSALIKAGINIAQTTGDLTRFAIPGDTASVEVAGTNVRVDMVFRILPGPGNYVTAGDRTSGLRVVPTSPTAISPGDGSFWSTYTSNNGPYGSAGGHPAGTFAARWSELVWNSARCDTVDLLIFPTLARNVGLTAEGAGAFASMLHESDPNYLTLGILKNRCFLDDTAGSINDVNCGRIPLPEPFAVFPPAWVTTLPGSYTGWDGSTQTREGTKIIPDGLLTPGSHVQYFFRLEDAAAVVNFCPDTSIVFPQNTESSTDAHRWQQFSVLPDAWKSPVYGGLNQACMLYVDWDDRRGNERVFVSVMDSIGATVAAKRGAHNGFSAPGTGTAAVNDPANFVNKNAQPGTTYDMYGVKAAESLNTGVGSLGARGAYRDELNPNNKAAGKVAKNAPTIDMLEGYYKILAILTGDLNSNILGPFNDKSSDDTGIIEDFLFGATAGANRGLIMQGNGFVEAQDGDPFLGNLSVSLRDPSYQALSGNLVACADLITQSVINPNGDIYGIDNSCLVTQDVLNAEAGGVPGSLYQPVGDPLNFPYIASVYHDAVSPNFWKSFVDGWEIEDLQGRYCASSYGRLGYFYNVFTNVFGTICNVAGSGAITLDTPQTGNGKLYTDFMTLGNNPVYKGSAMIKFGLSSPKKVTAKIYDVSGRLVRTLADGQLFKAGEHQLLWDGVDNHGRTMPRGVYFSSWETDGGASVQRKITFLK